MAYFTFEILFVHFKELFITFDETRKLAFMSRVK